MARPSTPSGTSTGTSGLHLIRAGSGREILLVHGGADPAATWRPLRPLEARWSLTLVHRRGYGRSPPALGPRSDFDMDAADLRSLLAGRPHVVGHSYGAVGAALAAGREPEKVRSLTLIEPPLFAVSDHPEVVALKETAAAVVQHGSAADERHIRAFLAAAGAPHAADGPLTPDLVRAVEERAHGVRPPWHARPDLRGLRDRHVPCLVVSGCHSAGLERVCDAVAADLGAQRLRVAGAGHFVMGATGFLAAFERFLESAG